MSSEGFDPLPLRALAALPGADLAGAGHDGHMLLKHIFSLGNRGVQGG